METSTHVVNPLSRFVGDLPLTLLEIDQNPPMIVACGDCFVVVGSMERGNSPGTTWCFQQFYIKRYNHGFLSMSTRISIMIHETQFNVSVLPCLSIIKLSGRFSPKPFDTPNVYTRRERQKATERCFEPDKVAAAEQCYVYDRSNRGANDLITDAQTEVLSARNGH